ncbi:MAG: cell shape-determining protein MreC [Cycloclasticus sp. symbiont of Poecilosclerida sp. M]|nr:MAG: cell shape-determining protein MreC [Cycloclasticus sp. symbiont of Poecilosclerida sp. M]
MSLIYASQKTSQLQWLRHALSYITHPILLAIDAPSQLYDSISNGFSDRATLLSENKTLKAERLILKGKLQKLDAIEKENTRLHSLLDSSFKLGEQFIVASLLRVSLDPFSHTVVVDKGSLFNLYVGQAALNADGVIGQITQVNALSASVMLITDPNHATPVEIIRTGLRTIATGNGIYNQLSLPYLPHNADIQVGDTLVTSGLGGLYPKGYPVATVSSVNSEPGQAFIEAHADTVAKIESSRELLLVWSNQQPIQLIPKKSELEPSNAE